jgi:hypothetical protein
MTVTAASLFFAGWLGFGVGALVGFYCGQKNAEEDRRLRDAHE